MPTLDVSGFVRSAALVWLVVDLWFVSLPALWLASEKGRDPLLWALAGVLFGPVALLVVGLAPRGASGRFGRCPACRESIDRDAEVCPLCRTRFRVPEDDLDPVLERELNA